MCSETWTNEYTDIEVDGFVAYSKHRVKKKYARRDSGGIVCYFREDVAVVDEASAAAALLLAHLYPRHPRPRVDRVIALHYLE